MKELQEFISLIIDYRGKTPLKLGLKWSNSGYRALSAKNIKTGRIVNEDSIYYGDETLYKLWMKDEVKKGDILITSEAPFGEVYFWDTDEKIILSQRLFCIRAKNIVPKYLYYAMTSSKFQAELTSRATGTTVTGLRQPELLKCKIPEKTHEEQLYIIDILGTLDEKIENNERLYQQIEKECALIFNQIMQSSATERIALSDVADFYGGYSYSGEELVESSDTGLVTIKNFERTGGFKIEGFKPLCIKGKIKESAYCEIGSLLVAHTDLTQNADIIGNPVLVLSSGQYKNLVASMDLVKVVPKSYFSERILYLLLKSAEFKGHALGYSAGTTVLHLSKKALQEYQFNCPCKDTIENLDRKLCPLFERLKILLAENLKLNKLKQLYLKKFFG